MKKNISPLLLLILFLAVAFPGWAEEKEPYLVKEFEMKPGGSLEVYTAAGSISVTGTSKNKATAHLFVRFASGVTDKSKIEEALKNYSIELLSDKNSVFLRAEKKDKNRSGKDDLVISFRVEVPSKTTCYLTTSGGSLEANNIAANTEMRTAGGSIAMSDFSGKLEAHTSGGSVSLTKAAGSIFVRTSGGSINLKNVAGDVDAQTSGGSISADIAKLGKFLTLATSGGSVSATIPKGQGLDLDLTGSRVKTDLANFKGSSTNQTIKGSVNGGGIPVKMSTSGGTTQLNYRM